MKRGLRRPVLVMALSTLMLAGCAETEGARQEAGSGAASPSTSADARPASPEPAATSSVAATATPRVVSPEAVVSFTSPTRNISCQMTGTASTCDIRDHSYTPPEPSAACDLDHGDMITVGIEDAASFPCHGDTASDPDATVLVYGQEISNGRFTCSSATTGITCVSLASRRGFNLSRARYRLF